MKGRKGLEAISTKACTICRKMKSIEDFYKRKDTPDGRHYYCKICSRKKRKKLYYMQKEETPENLDNERIIKLEKKIEHIEKALIYILEQLNKRD